MSFLTPIFLTGLVSVAVPLLIHQLTRRTRTVRELPTVRFLQQAAEHTRSYRRLREWLLLLLRMFILTALVLAFARPYFSRLAAAGETRQKNPKLVLVLDQSASMAYRKQGRSLLARARRRARELINNASDRTEFTVISYSDTSRIQVKNSSREEAFSAVAGLKVKQTGTRTLAALHRAGAVAGPKKVVLLSDLAKNGFESTGSQRLPDFREKLKIIDLSLNSPANRWIEAVRKMPARNNQLRLEIGTRGQVTSDTGRIYYTGEAPAQTVDLSNEFVTVNLADSRCGGYLDLGADSFALDRRWYFSLTPRKRGTVLNAVPVSAEPYLQALRGSGWASLAGTEELSPDAVLLLARPIKNSSRLGRLEKFVKQGGRLVLFQSALVAKSRLKQHRINPVKIHDRKEIKSGHRLRLVNGGGSYLGDLASATIRSPLFFDFFEVSARSASQVLASFTSNTPFLVSRHVGQGEVIFLNSTLDNANSDWVTHPLFPILMHRLVTSGRKNTTPVSWTTGEQISVEETSRVITGPGERMYSISTEGTRSFFVPSRPGLYRSSRRQYAVNLPPGESQPRPLKLNQLEQLLQRRGAKLRLSSREENPADYSTSGAGPPDTTWQWFLAAALVLMVPEIWLGRPENRGEEN